MKITIIEKEEVLKNMMEGKDVLQYSYGQQGALTQTKLNTLSFREIMTRLERTNVGYVAIENNINK